MTEYQQLLQAVEQYYGSGSDQWAEIAKYGIASKNAEQILKQVPGVNIVKNANGKIRSYNFAPTENIASGAEQAVNSNTPAVIKSFEVPANTGLETVTTPAGETVKQMTFKSGMSQAGKFVFGEVAPAVVAAATGITFGKFIDKRLYNFDPDFWDEHGMESLNPDTWNDITGNDTMGGRIFNTVFGLNPDGKTQAYMDENALAYMSLYLQNLGVFTTSQKIENINNLPLHTPGILSTPITFISSGTMVYDDGNSQTIDNLNNCKMIAIKWSKNNENGYCFFLASKDENATYGISGQGVGWHLTEGEKYYWDVPASGPNSSIGALPYSICKDGIYPWQDRDNITDITTIMVDGTVTESSGIGGIGTQEGAKTPDLSGASTPDEALNKLKEQYPDLWKNAVKQDVVQPDGSTKTYTYVPVAMPEIDKNGNPVSSSSNQAKPQVNPATATEPLLKLITKLIQKDPPVNPPDTGSGDAPVAPPVTGSASSLYAIYNPTLAEINSFGAWLWSDNFIDQIKKLFNDPMQAIIGLHKIYAQPITGGEQNIKVGYLDSGVSSAIVTNQYTTIDCGTVRLSEQFHNVFDYEPFTEVNLYLPFIGIVRLDISVVMRASIHIVYHVDVLSGACLADVKVVRDSSGGTLYQYAGNASVTLPISSGSYMGIVASVAGIAGGIAGTIASGGSALPLIASSASSMFNAHTRVEHSGGFSGNAGAMGGKIPYLIISRPQTAMAKEFNKYIGYPSNFTAKLGSCSGFVKVLECHLKNINATKSELDEIDSILKEGVII